MINEVHIGFYFTEYTYTQKGCSKNSILLVHPDAGKDHWLTKVKYNTTVGCYG